MRSCKHGILLHLSLIMHHFVLAGFGRVLLSSFTDWLKVSTACQGVFKHIFHNAHKLWNQVAIGTGNLSLMLGMVVLQETLVTR
jgi:hypothetical protein